MLKVRLYRPFSTSTRFVARAARDASSAIAVLDRTKEPGAVGEPLYQDVVTALARGRAPAGDAVRPCPRVIGGRYGLSAPRSSRRRMVKAVFDELAKDAAEEPLHGRHRRRRRPHQPRRGIRDFDTDAPTA
ncbi:MAG: hypothetical protein MZV65_08780 [Chromatiales bacterium]|nr:hypothetical protein [Chromatiales bacterium]